MKTLWMAVLALALAVPAAAQVPVTYDEMMATLGDEQKREVTAIRERADSLSMTMDAMVAYTARNILVSLAISYPVLDLRSWSITPIAYDRVIINGALYMQVSGAPGTYRSYVFTVTPQAGGG